jgi:hypothetical protein
MVVLGGIKPPLTLYLRASGAIPKRGAHQKIYDIPFHE